ncbi:RHS repeat-associated core domain-containing protein [Chryseobacterium sp. MEBOG06]|uniref:RHS repeat-associated core domain-containing protein n=1 Tax=Chryseobacterium sp. MEBOG06 TaxID=2879938 RepID=UPI0021D3FAAE|nr:RHS repeat-associated core domain-containing protein [Chryseobacterium sp. MEBOG06]UKB86356.1 RHS repeat-associated core domain-containing protein [Chryseobacterium sp. MEBOG06]
MDTNNYYPFGLNHISGSFGTSNFGSFYSYKYNGKELQETGMYDYGARMMMPDLGRWGAMDAMSEKYSSWSPYNYAINNPVMVIDPDGNDIQPLSEAQQAFKNYVATMSTGTETSGGNIFTGFNFSGFGTDDWIRGLDGKWRYDANITTLEKAMRMAGIDGFAKNGTIFSNVSVDGGSISAYARLNEGGSITKLGADDLASMNAIVDALPMWLGGTWRTWTNVTFYSFSAGSNDPDKETLNKLKPQDKIDFNNMFEYILGGYGRATKLNLQDGAFQFGLDIQGIGNPFPNINDTVYLRDYTFKQNSIVPIDTMYKTIPKKGESFQQTARRLRKTIDSVKSSK